MQIQAKCLLMTILSSSLLLAGCVNPGKDMIPQGGSMTMPEIYKAETGISLTGSDGKDASYSLPQIRAAVIGPVPTPDYVAYTATGANEINNEFKPLPNPAIPIYVFPHLVKAGDESCPKPGITTVFNLYKTNHFAMPGEVY